MPISAIETGLSRQELELFRITRRASRPKPFPSSVTAFRNAQVSSR